MALATTLYVIIFGIISDSYKEQSEILIPYTFNRTFFFSVEGDAFYYNQLPYNYKQIVWPCIWEGSSVLSKYRMDNLLKISQGIDSDLSSSIKIANQSNLSNIKTTLSELKTELNDIRLLNTHMMAQPGKEYDPNEIILRLNTYMDCKNVGIYRKTFGDHWFDLDTRRSCGGSCKAHVFFVFNEKDCPANAVKVRPGAGFDWKRENLQKIRQCLYFVGADGEITDYTDSVNLSVEYDEIRTSIGEIAGCAFAQDPTVLRTDLKQIFDAYVEKLRTYVVESRALVVSIDAKLDKLIGTNTMAEIDNLNSHISGTI